MKKWLKRIRGAVGMGLTWAAAWSPVGVIVGLVGVFGTLDRVLDYVAFAGLFAIMGFIGGAAFSVVLGIAEGRRRFDQMSLPRFSAWGALGGLPLSVFLLGGDEPLTLGVVLGTGLVVALMTAGSAAGSLTLARRAEDRELLEAGEETADIGLTEKETHELLGT